MQARPLLAVIILIGIGAAGGCAEAPPPAPAARGADVLLRAETETITARVPPSATLDSLLRQHQLQAEWIHAVIDAARRVFDPRDLRADRPYRLVRSIDGLLREFEYEIDADRFLRIVSRDRSAPPELDAQVLPIEKQTTNVAIRGDISPEHGSLIASIDRAGERVPLAMALAEIFSGQIDFENDLQPGDSYEVLFEKSTRDGLFAGYGEVLGAIFRVEGREYHAFRWVDPATGRAGFYDENGRSLKRMLRRSPLRFEPRVTSRFSRSRLHPVHGVRRPHLGVDYGAPHGAAVVAVADGIVVSAGWSGGGGRMVRLRHSGGLETYYLHLSSFGSGIRRGARVQQGKVIGFVGSTGTATGPHLDYRMRRNGAFVNPVTIHRQQPPGAPIRSNHLAAFNEARDAVLNQLPGGVLAGKPQARPDVAKAIH